MFDKKNTDPKTIWIQQKFLSKQIFGKKKFLVQDSFGSKNFHAKQNFGSNIFGPEIFYFQRFLVENIATCLDLFQLDLACPKMNLPVPT